ncbi:MAG: polyprenol phosphomannose-dependent alpha 1,6 mannosyltransferase MptB [Planctomycetota bacterium]
MSPTGTRGATSGAHLRRVLWALLIAHAALLVASLRQNFIWGEGRDVLGIDLFVLLGIVEGGALLTYVVLGGGAYARLRSVGGADRPRLRSGALVLTAAAVLVPPFLSTDLYDNLARGRVEAAYGANPYVTPPAAFPDDPQMEFAQWTEYGNPYGPASSLLQTAVSAVAGSQVALGAALFKLLAGLCHLATAYCVYRAARAVHSGWAATAFYLYAWNPFALLETAGSAHNDAVMALGLGAMVWALAGGRMAAATFAFGMAVLVKHSCAVLGPLLLVLAWRQRRLAAFAIGVLGVAAVTAALAAHYFVEPPYRQVLAFAVPVGALEALFAQAAHQRTSLQYFLSLLLGADHGPLLTKIGYGLATLALIAALPRVRDVESFGRAGVRVVMVFLLVGMPLFSPWYHLWWLPLLGVWPGAAPAVRLVGVVGPASYLVFASSQSYGFAHQLFAWGTGLVPVALLALWPERAAAGGRLDGATRGDSGASRH